MCKGHRFLDKSWPQWDATVTVKAQWTKIKTFEYLIWKNSWHQPTKKRILFFPNFLHDFFSVWAIEKENKLLTVQKKRYPQKVEKYIKKFIDSEFVDWWSDPYYQVHMYLFAKKLKRTLMRFFPKIGNDSPFFLSFIFGKLKKSKLNPKTPILVHCG